MTLMETVSASLPVEMIYSDYSTNPHELRQTALGQDDVREKLSKLKAELFGKSAAMPEIFRK